uniref:Uncharacterized protein n=1 Tax=Anguilla anguilla TaxID=7936 RepID=A0A0E9WM16_ANGAN
MQLTQWSTGGKDNNNLEQIAKIYMGRG